MVGLQTEAGADPFGLIDKVLYLLGLRNLIQEVQITRGRHVRTGVRARGIPSVGLIGVSSR